MAAALFYGSDVSCFDGAKLSLDLSGRVVTGARVVLESILRRWNTVRGSLVTDRSIGLMITDWIGGPVTPGIVRSRQAALRAEAMRDERVSDCRCVLTFDARGRAMTIAAIVTLADSGASFEFVITVTAASLTLQSLREAA